MQCMFLREQVLFFLCTVQQVVYYRLGKAESRTLCVKKFKRKKIKKINKIYQKRSFSRIIFGSNTVFIIRTLAVQVDGNSRIAFWGGGDNICRK